MSKNITEIIDTKFGAKNQSCISKKEKHFLTNDNKRAKVLILARLSLMDYYKHS